MSTAYLRLDPTRDYPTMVRGEGSYLFDHAGRRYLDAAGGIALVSVGYGRPEVAKAIADQVNSLSYCAPNLFLNNATLALADQLALICPEPIRHFHFVSGGSEATDLAIKISRQYQLAKGQPDRYRVISRWTSYHGATLGALSVSGMPSRRAKFLPLLMDMPHINPPYCYRCPLHKTYPGCKIACASELEDTIQQVGPETVAAFIMEPIIGTAGGGIVPPEGYHQEIRRICDKYGILLIADEVLTGFGRTGRMFAIEHFGIAPDLITMAKGISGGYLPLGAVGVSSEVRDTLVNAASGLDHVLTYGGHPVPAAGALEVLRILQAENLVERAAVAGKRLFQAAERLRHHKSVGDIRGLGLLMGIELVANSETKEPFDPSFGAAKRLFDLALQRGLVTYPAGDNLCIYPPLIVTDDQIDEIVAILDDAITAFESQVIRR